MTLIPSLTEPTDAEALCIGGRSLSYRQLRDAAASVCDQIAGAERVAVWAQPTLETCVAVFAGLAAGAAIVPLNPSSGEQELGHVIKDSAPEFLLMPGESSPPEAAASPSLVSVSLNKSSDALPGEPPGEAAAFVIYTSGTTGPPKGVVLTRNAIASNLDALAEAWEWTSADRLVHSLPLFHIHGLLLGIVGPIRLGGSVEHLGRFSCEGVGHALDTGASMLFGVPTMYHRLANTADSDPQLARSLASARLLVSGSAPLATADHLLIERLTGQRIVERYGLTETLINTAVRASGDRRPGYVGTPLRSTELKLVDEGGGTIDAFDDESIGQVAVRGASLFTEYLNQPGKTLEAFDDGWFLTGDLATQASDGYLRIVGRSSTDLIKSGGYKIGASEIEQALVEHPAVVEAAVTGEPDPELGERVIGWVATQRAVTTTELVDHVARLLSPHKRPREIRFVEALPRNEMGKIKKTELVHAA
jgi:malonyl-CoA/methylmalonyl-CoA synthetase